MHRIGVPASVGTGRRAVAERKVKWVGINIIMWYNEETWSSDEHSASSSLFVFYQTTYYFVCKVLIPRTTQFFAKVDLYMSGLRNDSSTQSHENQLFQKIAWYEVFVIHRLFVIIQGYYNNLQTKNNVVS